jgi:hypothetical protein
LLKKVEASPVTKPKVINQCADLINLDAAFESLDAIDGNHRDPKAITLEDGGITPDVHLIEAEVEIGGKVVQVRSCVITQVTASLRIEHDDGFHGRFFQAAYRSQSGIAHSGG